MSDSSTAKVSTVKSAATSDPPPRSGRPGRPGRPVRPDVPPVPAPRTIDLAAVAGGLVALALWVRAIGLIGHQSVLERYAVHYNASLGSKRDKHFTSADIASNVHGLRVSSVLSAAMLTAIMALLIWAMRRTRSASASRWGTLAVLVLPIAPLGVAFSIYPTWGFPPLAQAAGVASGVAGIAMVCLIFLPQSRAYFRECRDAMMPPEMRGQQRPGLGSMFKPRTQIGTAPGTRPAATRPAKTSASKAKAKVRSDADAIAKGAELARSRAKTSKTRR